MPEVGDTVTLRLTVDPADGTTAATVTVTSPTGTASTPAATPDADRSEWEALLLVDMAGEWNVRWTVTGVGAGVQSETVSVAPTGVSGPPGRVYASTADLAEFLGTTPPRGAARMLRRASREVDQLLRTAVYDVDDVTGLPTDPGVARALADAVCEQVEWWGELGDASGSGAVAALAGSQIGTVKLGTGAASTGGSLAIAPGAHRALQLAGLLNHGPRIPGGGRIAWR